MNDDFHTLTMSEIFKALPQHKFPSITRCKKEELLKHLEILTAEEKDILINLCNQKKPAGYGQQYFNAHDEVDVSKCFHTIGPDELKQCVYNFRVATSNAAVQLGICGVCAREMLRAEKGIENIPLSQIPNPHRLYPMQAHPSHTLYNRCLLAKPSITEVNGEVHVAMCQDCKKSLEGVKNTPPMYSLANNLWLGDIPWQLQLLTVPESLLISLVYPRVFVMKLFPKTRGHFGMNSETLQNGMKGNVSTYELNIDALSDMVQGKLMPQPPSILASLIAITFVGHGPLPKRWLKHTFGVRRHVILDALRWLKANNAKYYGDVEIDFVQLNKLPVDDIPTELLTVIRHEENLDMVDQEDTGYVPEIRTESVDADIIPLYYLGIQDMDLTKLSSTELMVWGLANLWKDNKEGGYVVRHGTHFVKDIGGLNTDSDNNTLNLFEQGFPCLFPYGTGGMEAPRPVPISFIDHIRWALQYYDRRFQLHATFPFYAYGLWIKRQALTSVQIEMQRKAFNNHAIILNSICLEDLRQAAEEERKGLPISNPAVSLLRRCINTSAIRVPGSNQQRIALRSKIRSTIAYLAPPNLWITINPHDIDDPIAHIFAGNDIDMDNFSKSAGPSSAERSKTIAADPYAAAKFFHFLINVILQTLFGISVTNFKVISSDGIFGPLNAYIGTVESQGRGTLHLHMLLFLKNAPSASEMRELLKSHEFRQKVSKYIEANIHAFIPGMSTAEEIYSEPVEKEVAYSRPPDTNSPDFEVEFRRMEKKIARSQQLHSCDEKRCLRMDKYGQPKCKRNAPWETAKEAYINEDGSWCTHREFPYFTAWNPSISVCNRCNNDIKLITNGPSTKKITFYICCYSAKKQGKSYNASALLAENLFHHFENSNPVYTKDLLSRNRLLLFRCLHILNREQEVSGPMVMSLLMGWNTIYLSHQYVPIFWNSFVGYLFKICPELRPQKKASITNEINESCVENTPAGEESIVINLHQHREPEESADEEQRDQVTLELSSERTLQFKCQITDYRLRGKELENYSVLDFFTDTYEEVKKKNKPNTSTANEKNGSKRGRRSNLRSCYLVEHPKHESHLRVMRSSGHNTLPNICGQWFPSCDDEEMRAFYSASMLMLFHPWRNISDLKESNETWGSAYERFRSRALPQILHMIGNIQYFYECQTEASLNPDEDIPPSQTTGHEDGGEEMGVDMETMLELDMPADEVETPCVDIYTQEAIAIGRQMNMLVSPELSWSGGLSNSCPALLDDIQNLYCWKSQLEQPEISDGAPPSTVSLPTPEIVGHGGYIIPEELYNVQLNRLFGEEAAEEALTSVDPSCLLSEQCRAYDIVTWHLNAVLEGKEPPQLLMQIQGEGGTGKSKVIQTITDFFAQKRSSAILVKAAYTGIAASLINGKTTHSIARIGISQKKEISVQTKNWLTKFWNNIQYLILDECSMISREFLANLEQHISVGKGFDKNTEGGLPFGGVNVILCGDFHQFPPVVCNKRAPLYYDIHPGDSIRAQIGRKLYEEFQIVVLLEKQVRVTDTDWLDFLRHLRIGHVKDTHIPLIQRLSLTHPDCPPTDFSKPPWGTEAVLVTLRHSVRIRWNSEMMIRHCCDQEITLFICPAKDTINGRPLTVAEKKAFSAQKVGRNGNRNEINGLPASIELAVGAKVMVTVNIDTNIDIANGSRGEITKIVLDPREQLENGNQNIITLEHPPLYILVKLQRTRAAQLHGLDPGVIPILPVKRKITIKLRGANGKPIQHTVTRMQLPVTPGYAFTDYRSQGQTISHVIVDLARPPSGNRLTNFNYYVALSRSSGRETIRLLRDLDISVLKQPQNMYLEREDGRLRELSQKTKEWWDSIKGNEERGGTD